MDRGGGSGKACYYSILEISKEASFSDVRTAYRKLAMKWHPDRCQKNQLTTEEANNRFQKIQEAYSVLSDQAKRSMYNAGMLNLYEDEDDEGMKEFMRELFTMADNNQNKQESFEDLQKSFMEIFSEELAEMAGKDNLNNSSESRTSDRCR
ncbi:uncharacterized protein LOC141664733 [Apium graveolens]|uniref:uncharacterized protein LOC141664733 n=1 Tax=Apium graveolens TaxID=4045 RepID=UPI003D7B5CEC